MDFRELKNLIKGRVKLNEPVGLYTTYHLGGEAAALVEPQGVEDLAELLAVLPRPTRSVPYLMLGGGSNVLFADEGFKGVVIRLGRGFQGIHIEGDRVRVKAATPLVKVLQQVQGRGFGRGRSFSPASQGPSGAPWWGTRGPRRPGSGPRSRN